MMMKRRFQYTAVEQVVKGVAAKIGFGLTRAEQITGDIANLLLGLLNPKRVQRPAMAYAYVRKTNAARQRRY